MLKLLIVLAIFFITVKSRGNINLGRSYGAHLIYHETHEKYGIVLMKRSEDVTVKGVGDELIRAISVHDLNGDGLSYIVDGGVGARSVTIRLESGVRGNGYKFLIEVYAM